MSALASEAVLTAFLVFCRVGSCLMIAPGLGTARVPAQVRLFIALALSLALVPVVGPAVAPAVRTGSPVALLSAIATEGATGLFIGLLSRLFFMALQTLADVIANAVGMAGMIGVAIEEDEPAAAIATLFTMTATALIFVSDLHWEILRGLVASYHALPPLHGLDMNEALIELTDRATDVFLLALRIASPFLIFSIIVNLAIGITNKLTPQLPVYFIATPFVTAGGLLLAGYAIREAMIAFTTAYGSWLVNG